MIRRRAIVWFRRDLRLADNPALAAAAAEGEVVGVFVVDPAFDRAGLPRRAFLSRSLADLDRGTGGALVCRRGDPVEVIARLAAEVGASTVFAAADAGPYGRRRDDAVRAALAADGRRLELLGSPYAVAPGTVRKGDGAPYSVFTPFFRAWTRAATGTRATGTRATGTSVTSADDVDWVTGLRGDGLPAEPGDVSAALPAAGEAAAHAALDAFVTDRLARYATDRDRPAAEGTSRLSPYLRWGELHPGQLLDHLGDGPDHEAFRAELGWREFYADVLFHRPETAWRNLRREMDALPVDTDAAARRRFAAWAAGQTGFPLVDAGMRELLATGWMHNRVRMVTAGFLVKDLHLPWQWGARHFLLHLVDGDLASNNHGWQWAAGTGTDAAPYFRIFNPTTQAQRFDPDGTYIRRWIPALEGVPDRAVHAPAASRSGVPLGYVPPIVDHATEREEALRRSAAVTGR